MTAKNASTSPPTTPTVRLIDARAETLSRVHIILAVDVAPGASPYVARALRKLLRPAVAKLKLVDK